MFISLWDGLVCIDTFNLKFLNFSVHSSKFKVQILQNHGFIIISTQVIIFFLNGKIKIIQFMTKSFSYDII